MPADPTVSANAREDRREHAQHVLYLATPPGTFMISDIELRRLARRLIAACLALEDYQSGVRAFRAGDPSSAMMAFADAEDALAEGDKD